MDYQGEKQSKDRVVYIVQTGVLGGGRLSLHKEVGNDDGGGYDSEVGKDARVE